MIDLKGLMKGYLIIFSGFLAVLGSVGLARFSYSMILPGMKDGLKLTYTQMGFIESGNFLGYMVFAILGGILASKYGPRMQISSCLGLAGFSMMLTGFIENYHQALIMRTLTGFGSGGSFVPAMMLPAAFFHANRRGLASGVIASACGAGLMTTGFVIPKLNVEFGVQGWRYSWLILGATTLCFSLFCWVVLKKGAGKTTLISHSAKPLKWALIRAPIIWKLGLVYFMFGISYVIYITFFGAYLVNEAGLSLQKAGYLWSLIGSLSLTSGPLWGYVSDRIGRGYGLAIVYSIQSLSFLLFSLGIGRTLEASAILFGVTAWSIASIMASYSGDLFGYKTAFSVFGLLTLFFGIGQALGPTIAGYIIDRVNTFTLAFLLSSILAALGCVLSLKMLVKVEDAHAGYI